MKTSFVCTAAAVFALVGCGTIFAVRDSDVRSAQEKKDLDFLKKVCSGDLRTSGGSEQHSACQAIKEIEGESLAENVDSADCGTLEKSLESSVVRNVDQLAKIGVKLVKCGKANLVFEDLAARGDFGTRASGFQILMKIEDSGVNLAEEFVKYAQSNAGPQFMAAAPRPGKNNLKFAINHISLWLDARKHYNHCSALVPVVRDASEDVKLHTLIYFANGQCKDAVPFGVELLSHSKPEYRKIACSNLGVFGDTSVVPKLEIVAETDSAYEIVNLNKIYYVRDICRASTGKIKLRAK